MFSPVENILFSCIRIAPTKDDLIKLEENIMLIIEWDLAAQLLIEKSAGPLFFNKLPILSNSSLICPDIIEKLKQSYYKTLSRGMYMYTVFNRTVELLQQAGVELIVLKGAYLAESLYKDIALRQFSDIDLLISEADGEKCVNLLKNHGYIQSGEEISHLISKESGLIHYPPMVYQQVSVELHIRLVSPNEKFRLEPAVLFDRSVKTEINGQKVNVLEFYDLIIYSCLHIDKHVKIGHVQFTSFNDLVNLLDQNTQAIQSETFIERCKECVCEDVVLKYILLVAKYYQITLSDEFWKQYDCYLTLYDETLFLSFLRGEKHVFYGVGTHIHNIQKTNGIVDKVKYLTLILFPSRAFMLQKYRVKNSSMFWVYYFIRYWSAIKGLIKLFIGSWHKH